MTNPWEMLKSLNGESTRTKKCITSSDEKRFSYANWLFVYGHLPFRSIDKRWLAQYDGQKVIKLGNLGYCLKDSLYVFDPLCVMSSGEKQLSGEALRTDIQLFDLYMKAQNKELMSIPYSFSTPVAIIHRSSMNAYIAMASISGFDDDGYPEFILQTQPIETNLVAFVLGRPLCNGFIENNSDLMVYYLPLDQLMEETNSVGKILQLDLDAVPRVDWERTEKYYTMLYGYTDRNEYNELVKRYEEQCSRIITFIAKIGF